MTSLPGADRYQRSWADPRRESRHKPVIDQANQISIVKVLYDICGIYTPSGMTAGSWKQFCPFDFEHPDRNKKGFRVYETTNTSYCFVLHGTMRPVRLVQLTKEFSTSRAAYWLLDYYGLVKPKSYRKRFEELLIAREQRQTTAGNPAYLVEALHHALAQVPNYNGRQFDSDVTELLDEHLVKLDSLLGHKPSEEQLRQWLMTAKDRLVQVIEGEVQ